MKHYLLPFLCLLVLPLTTFAQGDLAPRGGPAPTMRTLDQVEPRTPIDAAHTPGDTNNEFIISQAGSYYLTANVGVGKNTGIRVAAEGVTIDLNGFQIARSSGSGGNGILIAADGCTVKNGSVNGFGAGVGVVTPTIKGGSFLHLIASNCSGIGLGGGLNWRLEGCTARTSGQGIEAGAGSTLINCAVGYCGPSVIALSAGPGSNLVNCVAYNNTAEFGIFGGHGSTLINCSARDNTAASDESAGIVVSPTGTAIGCSAAQNTSTNATPSGTTGMGIYARDGAVVKDCSASFNRGDGIRVENLVTVSGNVCVRNNQNTGVGAGIHAVGQRNRIQNNNVASNDAGIRVTGSGNLIEANHVRDHSGPGIQVTTSGKNVIIRNVAGDNVNSYSGIVAGNQVGPIDTNFTSTNPFANFQN